MCLKSVRINSETRSAKDCFRITTTCLGLARRAEESWEVEHHATTGVVFAAFSIEAMINHYGKLYFVDWNTEKGNRKDLHKKLFKAVNLPNYLGSKEYQNAKACFELRDMFAHGKTKDEIITIELEESITDDEEVTHIMQISAEQFRKVNLELLQLFVDTARTIQKDIESNGFYPNQSHVPVDLRSRLCEMPLSTSGVRSW